MVTAKVEVKHSAEQEMDSGWKLCFQHCIYYYDNGTKQEGYRFIWKRGDGTLQAARGQARLPSIAIILKLTSMAMAGGWGNYNEDIRCV